jgi:16S rRNA (guanine966-N2)-methyltransferase
MRIVGGRFRGRALVAPAHEGTRPTSDRVRESVFNILTHGVPDFTLEGAKVLDLFAGTGALGIEALSRGATFCLFIEEEAEARAIIRRNIEAFGLTGASKIFRRDATDLGPAGNRGDAALVFLDPPYGQGLAERALASLSAGGWLAPGAIAVIEERKGTPLSLQEPFTRIDHRNWGDTDVTFARFG